MSNSKLRGKDLQKINYKSDRAKSLAIEIAAKHWKHWNKQEKLEKLQDVLLHPKNYFNHDYLNVIAREFEPEIEIKEGISHELEAESKPYKVFGKKFIDDNTINQMDLVMKLPIAHSGALMPDAHVGYGLPIGSVLATENQVIPYGVGLDIGCRMSLTIYNVPDGFIERNKFQIKTALKSETHFGIGKISNRNSEHEVLENEDFKSTELLRKLHGKACKQLGTSGSGNHFVEVGTVVLEVENKFGLAAGNYVGIMAHSGSRGFGATVASYYMQVALDKCWLPKKAQHLSWLDLATEAGQEYWIAMNLAGEYAKACHDVIHSRLAKSLGLKPHVKIENHHNFARKEAQADGRELIVHRKGATPAQKDVMGIIPANMKDAGYLVSGLGNEMALQSAAHGAGRKMSRSKAKNSITGSELKKVLRQTGIDLIGGGVDESPMVYKDLEKIMPAQNELVKVEGKFFPKVVRMDKN